jgi:hypothetical protein
MSSSSNISAIRQQWRDRILIPMPYETHFHQYTIADASTILGMDAGEWVTMKKKVYFPVQSLVDHYPADSPQELIGRN